MTFDQYLEQIKSHLNNLTPDHRKLVLVLIEQDFVKHKYQHADYNESELVQSFGDAELVAKRYQETAQYMQKKAGFNFLNSFLKWTGVGCLGIIILFMLSVGGVFWKLSSLFGEGETQHIMKFFSGQGPTYDLFLDSDLKKDGVIEKQWINAIDISLYKKVLILATDIKMNFSSAEGSILNLRCKVSNQRPLASAKEADEVYTIDFRASGVVKCDLVVPINYVIQLKANQGQVNLNELQNSIDIEMNQAQVQILPSPESSYIYDLNITNGLVQEIPQKNKKVGYPIRIKLNEGKINFIE